MNGAHDLGGMHGFGEVDVESGKKLFHAEWEKRVFAMTLACGFLGKWNIDQSRFAREQMAPGAYLQSSYYEHWLHGLETLLLERAMVSTEELRTGKSRLSENVAIPAERVASILSKGGPADCPTNEAPKFTVGDRVRIKNQHPAGHTRSPRFTRGQQGVIERYHGSHVLPDISSKPEGIKTGAHLYSVRFEANTLWGDDGEMQSAVFVDVFEPYMDHTK